MGWGVYLAQDALSKKHVEASYVEISADSALTFLRGVRGGSAALRGGGPYRVGLC
ncbi:hypothetical protein NCPHL90_01424 [Corynebacterium diphtheriae]|nr:hypothetical protein CIP107518_01402 [Corynebacterium diphtheriae]CAB0697990.1 hypothetical protein FRC0026_01319 [Corynebacterium diphtheriae]VVH29993.1 hypothetical protein NCPHL90_01424 [Corynebacterium diphtheriae]